jgi:hypothetical protein
VEALVPVEATYDDHDEEEHMQTLQDVQTWRGMKMVDADGDKIGAIEDILLDRQTGEPAWAAVKTGLFGLKQRRAGDRRRAAAARGRGRGFRRARTGAERLTVVAVKGARRG